MKRKFIRTVFVAMAMMATTAVLFITGCGGDDDGPPANIAGTWSGAATFNNGETGSVTTTLTQDGKNVSGTSNQGSVSGVVDGNSVALIIQGSDTVATTEMTVNGESMSGTIILTGPRYPDSLNGTINLTRVATGA